MARRRRKARVVKPVEVEEEILEEELLEEDEEEEEEVKPKPKTRRRRKKVVEPEPEDEEEEEEVAKPAPRRKRAKKVVEPEPEETFSSADMFDAILDGLEDGQLVVITASGDDEWVLSTGTASAGAGSPQVTLLKGRAYHDEVLAEEFLEWRKEWQELTFSEKKAQAKKVKATWEPHDDPRVEVMRIAAAVRVASGIEKYKPQYSSRAARAAIRA